MSEDVMKLVDAPPEWDTSDKVEVCGNIHPLREFSMAERHLWLKVRDEVGLDAMIQEFSELSRQIEEFDEGTLAEVYMKRANKLDEEVSRLVEETPRDKWDEKLEARLNEMVVEASDFRRKARDASDPKRKAVAERSPELSAKLEALNEKQSVIFLTMTWNLARSMGEKRPLQEYIEAASGIDRIAAQEVVEEGNFTWEARGLNRSQRRALLKNRTRSRA